MPENEGGSRLAILLASGAHDRAHAAFTLAASGAALGRAVTVFAMNGGCRALLADPSGLEDWPRDGSVSARGVAGLETLRDACRELGVVLLACDAGLRAEGLAATALAPGAEVAGAAAFLSAAAGATVISL